jgi:hypothetical protein
MDFLIKVLPETEIITLRVATEELVSCNVILWMMFHSLSLWKLQSYFHRVSPKVFFGSEKNVLELTQDYDIVTEHDDH